jgi:RsiW-degrading membrane proteinase PrsW (M82 family)
MSNAWGPPPGVYQQPPLPEGRKGLGCQIAGIGCGGALTFLLATLLLLLFVLELGPIYLSIAFLMAFLPAVIYTSIVLLIDRFDPEPPWVLALAFLWGAVISIFGALIVNDTATLVTHAVAGEVAAELVGSVVSAPIAEEAMKGIGLLIVFVALRKEFDGVVDGIVYACMIALGFATVENILYYGRGVAGGGVGAGAALLVLRGIMSPFAHPLFTSMTGIGVGIARELKRGPLVWIAPVLGYLMAVVLHATWNGLPALADAVFGDAAVVIFFLAYLLGWIPAFLCFLGAIAYCLNRERKIIQEHLREELALGVLSPEEYAAVISPTRRFRFRMESFKRRGYAGYRDAGAFARTATRLALSKWHTLNASRRQAETRSLGMIPVLRQELSERRAALWR